jgi:excisionase family DNA binding protein
MIESKIKEIAASRGIRSSYGLQKALDIAPSNALRLWEGKVTRFSVEILDKLCQSFGVSVGDLLVYRKGENDTESVIQDKDSISANISNVVEMPVNVPANSGHQSVKVDPEKPASKPVKARAFSKADEGMLSTVEVAKRLGLSRKSVSDYIVSDKLKATKGKGNHNFISEADLQEFINNR